MAATEQAGHPDEELLSRIRNFNLSQVLNHDRAGMRLVLLGTIAGAESILILERASFPSPSPEDPTLSNISLLTSPEHLQSVKAVASNDVYASYLASLIQPISQPNVKLSLVHPCTQKHIAKYSHQKMRSIVESPEIFKTKIWPLMVKDQEAGRLNWAYNILDGKAEQDQVLYRSPSSSEDEFVLLPDLYWDRKTMTSLHLLALPIRRDLLSIRDLTPYHVPFLEHLRREILKQVTSNLYPEAKIQENDLKFYFHYQPTYYHLHIHVVHVMYDGGMSQAVGKAWGLELILQILKNMKEGSSMADIELVYTVGENHDLWKKVYGPEAREVGR